MRQAKLPAPVFEYNTSFFVSLHDKTHLKVTEKVTERVTEKVTENQEIILEEMAKNREVTVKELSKTVGITGRKIKENILKLKQKGLIERIGSHRGGYWQVVGTQRKDA